MHGPLGSINQVCGCISCNPSVKEAEARGSDIQGHLGCSGVGDQSEIHETMSLKQNKKILAGLNGHTHLIPETGESLSLKLISSTG